MRLPSMACCVAVWLALAAPASAGCSDPSGFSAWLDGFKRDAVAQGISQQTVDTALDGVTYDRNTVSHDRGQGVFRQSFEQFSARMANNFRVTKGRSLIARNAGLFGRIESEFGVPGPILVAIWGLETDFGAYMGNFTTIRSLATLAYDCRRSAEFRAELMDALRIVERGDMNPASMHGAWAGEIGQTQFMPSSYLKFAVDFDGDGRRDLIHSVPDVLASTAKFLQNYGWQRGAGWNPGEPNFAAIQAWNKSSVYSRTIALLADKVAGTAYSE